MSVSFFLWTSSHKNLTDTPSSITMWYLPEQKKNIENRFFRSTLFNIMVNAQCIMFNVQWGLSFSGLEQTGVFAHAGMWGLCKRLRCRVGFLSVSLLVSKNICLAFWKGCKHFILAWVLFDVFVYLWWVCRTIREDSLDSWLMFLFFQVIHNARGGAQNVRRKSLIYLAGT